MKPNWIVYLFGINADKDGTTGPIPAGLYEVIEYCPTEPSAYVWSPIYLVLQLDAVNKDDEHDWENHLYTVDADDFDSVVNPKSFGRSLADEREWELEQIAEDEKVCNGVM